MRGAELQMERAQRRAELRRAASLTGYRAMAFLALDLDELVQRASLSDVGAQGNAVKRRLVVDALHRASVTDSTIAAAWNLTPETLAREASIPLLDGNGIAAAIEEQVREELPETDEPGRVVPPEPAIAPAWARGERVAGS